MHAQPAVHVHIGIIATIVSSHVALATRASWENVIVLRVARFDGMTVRNMF